MNLYLQWSLFAAVRYCLASSYVSLRGVKSSGSSRSLLPPLRFPPFPPFPATGEGAGRRKREGDAKHGSGGGGANAQEPRANGEALSHNPRTFVLASLASSFVA